MTWRAIYVLTAVALAAPVCAQGQDPRIETETFDCLMDAAARVKLGAQIAGVLSSVSVERGARVRAGQQIAQLAAEVEDASAELARVRSENDTAVFAGEAKLVLARRKLARMTSLRANNSVTEKDFDEATSDARVAEQNLRDATMNRAAAQAELKRAEALVRQRAILSPIDGVVVERHLSPGEYVHDQAYIVSLARIDVLHVEVFVPVAYLGQVVAGGHATVMPDAPVRGQYAAEVTIVDRVIDSSSGTFGVRLRLDNPEMRLPAGLRCRIRFDGAKGRISKVD